ncbi:MAG TPA: NO-inducible flavohemoprotein [Blastocatellia bacterium]|nr:NO-inducible flavohemoprotein [Blastocatellia bacterium]
MLDQKTVGIVKASAPLLAERGLEVTMRMYDLMFSDNPEVLPLFNRANQTPEGQPLALARSIYAYATQIENLEALAGAVELIANKHASLGVKPEHYAIVGKHLIQALKDVLKIDEEQVAAWGEAYWFLANILIDGERKLYDQAAGQDGGWADYRTFVLDRKVAESSVIASFYLKPGDGKKIAPFKPGQYVTAKFEFPGGQIVTRNYSLSDSPNGEYYRISVKKERRPAGIIHQPDGLVSCYLHDYYQPGMEVQLRAPMGNFVLNHNTHRPVALLSGGVGLTPMISMLNTIARQHPQLETWFIHGALNRRTHAMGDHVRALAAAHSNIHAYVCYSEPGAEDLAEKVCDRTGLITAEWLEQILPHRDCDFYFCGPRPFMQLVHRILKEWKVPPAQIHYEFFGPAGELS